jgi:hypothetical protein
MAGSVTGTHTRTGISGQPGRPGLGLPGVLAGATGVPPGPGPWFGQFSWLRGFGRPKALSQDFRLTPGIAVASSILFFEVDNGSRTIAAINTARPGRWHRVRLAASRTGGEGCHDSAA